MGVNTDATRPVKTGGLAGWARSRSLNALVFEGHGVPRDAVAALAEAADLGVTTGGHSPRQADLLIVAGRITIRQLPVVQRIWRQMPEPKWCLAFGANPTDGADTYALIDDLAKYLPIDHTVAACPPDRETFDAAIALMRDIAAGKTASERPT